MEFYYFFTITLFILGMDLDEIKMFLEIVRADVVSQHGEDNLHGTCIEASELISKELNKHGIKNTIVEGWCLYDDENYGSDRPYDEHTWVEIVSQGKTIVLDVTLDQFKYGMDEPIPPVYIGEKPEFLVYEEPDMPEENDEDFDDDDDE